MGAVCSKVEDGGDKDRVSTRRMSFSQIKRGGKGSSILKPGSEYLQTYSIGDTVGSDDMVVSATSHQTQVEYVARAIEKSEMPCQDMAGVEDHLCLLSGLDHCHMCRFIEAFDCNERIQLVYERASSVSIFEEEPDLAAGNSLPEEAAQSYCRQIAMALSVAHKQGIVHGRLTESSFLVDLVELEPGEDRSLKICDMGQTFALRSLRNGWEQLDYKAPESLWDELPTPSSTIHLKAQIKAYQSVDLWALGIILYRMLTAKVPFPGVDEASKKESIKKSVPAFGSEWDDMPHAKELVQSLLKGSGRIRMTAEKVLKHPWITLSKTKVSRSKMMRLLQNVLFNTTETTFKKFTMRVIAEGMCSEKIEIVTKLFRAIDRNGDGVLEIKEIRDVLRKYGEEEGAADEIFEAIDRDASGTLNFAEFTAVSIGPSEYHDRETLWQTFNRFDKDGNGAFDKSEIMTVVKEVENMSDPAGLEKEVDEIAKDVDMPVDFDSFVQTILCPAGQNINKMNVSYDRFCYSVLKVDNHKVRHITPKQYDPGKPISQLARSPYSRSSQYMQEGDSPKGRRSTRVKG